MPRALKRPHRLELRLSPAELEAVDRLRVMLALEDRASVVRRGLSELWATHSRSDRGFDG